MPRKKIDDTPRPKPYVCSSCGREQEREALTVKKAMFKMFGRNGRVLRSRVVAWLCSDCREKDIDWTRDDSKGGPPQAPKVKA